MSLTVWFADVAVVREEHLHLLSEVERGRRERYRMAGDQDRFTAAAALLRLAVAGLCGVSPRAVPVDRTCDKCGEPHGKTTLPGTGLHASISHSGKRVAVACTDDGPVGVDVEAFTERDVLALARSVVNEAEPLCDRGDFYTYWCRKEAVVKATGDGLRVPLVEVVVSPPGEQPPRLLAFPGRPAAPACLLRDVPVDGGYAAAVAVLTEAEPAVRVADGTLLLEEWKGG